MKLNEANFILNLKLAEWKAHDGLQISIPLKRKSWLGGGRNKLERFMGTYVHRVTDAILGSAFLPASVRGKLMRLLGFKMAPDACVWSGASFRSKRIQIGSEVFINVGFFYDGDDDVVIENNVRIGQFVRLITGSHEIGPSTQRCLVKSSAKPICIEAGCWIGSSVTILPGVTIRRGCVIAAGSIVTKSTEPDSLYAGTPARFVKKLSDPRGEINNRFDLAVVGAR